MNSARLSLTARIAIFIWTIVISWSCFPKSIAAQGIGNLTHDPEGDATSALCFNYGYGVINEGEACDVFLQVEILKDTNSEDFYTDAYEVIYATQLVSNGWYPIVINGIYRNNASPSYIPSNSPEGINNASYNGFPAAQTTNVNTPQPITLGNAYESVGWGYLQNNNYHYCTSNSAYNLDPCPTSNNPLVQLAAIPPNITSITPTYGYVGTSGQITVVGTNLVNPFTEIPQPSFNSGSGVKFQTPIAGTENNVVLNYDIDQNATTGPRTLSLQTLFGTATSSQTFNVGDPTPKIISVTPDPWQYGNQYSITITGSGFGTNKPIITITSPGGGSSITLVSQGTSSTPDTVIPIVISISPVAPSGQATVQVQSTGYSGNPFWPAISGGLSTSQRFPIMVQGISPPVPVIQLFGNTLMTSSLSPMSLLAGQLIALTETTPALPPGYSLSSQSWSLPNGDTTTGSAVGGFTNPAGGTPDYTGGCIVLIQGQTPVGGVGGCTWTTVSTTGSSFNFYYVSAMAGTTITYTYTACNLCNGTDTFTGSATEWFSVAAPTGVSVTVTPASRPVTVIPGSGPIYPLPFEEVMAFGQNPASQFAGIWGMTFVASLPPAGSAGSYTWVQLVSSDATRYVGVAGQTPVQNSITGSPWLDGAIPYGYIPKTGMWVGSVTGPFNNSAADSPDLGILSSTAEAARSFSAQMYLMWRPTTGISGCTLLCDIPIPLGVVYWQYSGDTINTGQNAYAGGLIYPYWTLNGPGWSWNSGYTPASFPVWTQDINANFFY